MVKYKRMVVSALLFGLLFCLVPGCNVMDGGGMINPFDEMLEVLSGNWKSADGKWLAVIDGYNITLQKDGMPVLDDSYTLSLPSAENANGESDLELYHTEIKCEAGVIGSIGQLCIENGKLYMSIAYDEAYSEYPGYEKEIVEFAKAEEGSDV